ncbi:metal-dependent hydrolase [Natrononativus amylolyticus]|uniref:metal-dependent hydrolase n=1 Tax=Natrononativus amylolyticus TaxID=2963434 RepID=UPI0020CFB147|nr:metal-dependent hydrolase [Natrononativus amylolyticus]
MAELLTHVLVAYACATALSWRYEWLTPRYVTVAMAAAMIPDLNRIGLLVPGAAVETVVGVPFDWGAMHTLGGSLLVVCLGALVVPARYRRRVFLVALLGMLSHHALDLLLVGLSGHSYLVLWPLTQYHPPTPSLYLSSDRWPALVALLVAAGVRFADRRRSESHPAHGR